MRFASILVIALAGCLASCSGARSSNANEVSARPSNDPERMQAPYLVLVSIDGFRHDYLSAIKPPHLGKLAEEGATAVGMDPVYPSKTFPNHVSIVTGLHPARHGIVGNEFFAPDLGRGYALKDKSAVRDGAFYLGEPIWVTSEKNGLLAASCFWVGSEAEIQGRRPSYYLEYDEGLPNLSRVKLVLSWLGLPARERPHLLTLYFSEVDSAGHAHGPESKELAAAVLDVDRAIGELVAGIRASGLPVSLVVVSDHGMRALEPRKFEEFGGYADLSTFDRVGNGSTVYLYAKKGGKSSIRAARLALAAKARHFKVYENEKLPKSLFPSSSPRLGDLVLAADTGWSIGEKRPAKMPAGNHGWDPALDSQMSGLFIAWGPRIKSGRVVPRFRNVDAHPLLLRLLGLDPLPGVDGNPATLESILLPAPEKNAG